MIMILWLFGPIALCVAGGLWLLNRNHIVGGLMLAILGWIMAFALLWGLIEPLAFWSYAP